MNAVKRLVLATTNKGKIAELRELLADFGVEAISAAEAGFLEEVDETGRTFAENALLKAQAVAKALGGYALADDSGLEVDALGGAPGVHSARFAEPSRGKTRDEANNEKLLAALVGVPAERRTARFRCVLAVASPTGDVLIAEGAWEGRIAEIPAGEHGFGYDPLFFDAELGLTAAQLDKAQKNARSHRGKALAELKRLWPGFASGGACSVRATNHDKG